MAADNDKSRLFTRRAVMIGAAQTGLVALLMGRLYYLQVIQGDNYHAMAEENRINLRLVAAPRGHILDHNDQVLALNDQTFRVILLPEQITNLTETLDTLAAYVPLDYGERKRIAHDFQNRDGFNAVIVRDDLSRDQIDVIAVHMPELSGIDIDAGEIRSYPYGEVMAHILGYVGVASTAEIEQDEEDKNVLSVPGVRVGKSGIERQYENELRGTAGDVQMEVNAHGRVVRELARHNPIAGKELKLTIDAGLQQFVHRCLVREEGAAAVILDVQTGAIRAMASHPSFDPNLFTFGIGQEDWDQLNNDIHSPMLNKAISGVYAPGSTIKPMVAMAALEDGLVNPDARIFCPGYYEFGEHTFYCWKHGGHGSVNMVEAIAGSCDTYFYDLGRKVGIDRLETMAKRFGFGQKLGIDMPHERAGLVPGRAWKQSTQHQSWEQGETLIAAIGQGFMLATPLQLAVMAARFANGGMAIVPHVVERVGTNSLSPAGPSSLGFDPRHLEIVTRGMDAVVNSNIGTAYATRLTRDGFSFAGKTGTAQVRHISQAEHDDGVAKNEALPWKERDHALFAGFAPVATPRYALAVIIEHGGSGAHQAAPLARDIFEEILIRNI